MHLFELDAIPDGRRTEKDDNTVLKLSDLRKTRITLAHLNKLRIANDVRKVEHEKKLKNIANMYATQPDAAAGGAGAPAMGV